MGEQLGRGKAGQLGDGVTAEGDGGKDGTAGGDDQDGSGRKGLVTTGREVPIAL
jgi:hypothetical protein